MKGLVIRNLKLYFKDKGAVFFSLLGVLIVIGLYILFLGDTFTDGLKEFYKPENIMSGWIMAGLLAITSLTTTMGAFSTMIQDKEKKIFKDFYCAPISRSALSLGYIISSVIIGLLMTLLVFVIAIIYLAVNNIIVISFTMILKLIGIFLLNTCSNTAMALFIVSLLNTEKTFSAVSGITSALIGFVTGIYLPVGQLPEYVQYIVKCFPTSHGAVLFRQILMEDALNKGVSKMPTEAKAVALKEVKNIMGVTFKFGDTECATLVSVLVLVVALVLFSALSIWNINRKKAV